MNEIDASLQQIAPEERHFANESKFEKVSAEGKDPNLSHVTLDSS